MVEVGDLLNPLFNALISYLTISVDVVRLDMVKDGDRTASSDWTLRNTKSSDSVAALTGTAVDDLLESNAVHIAT